MKSMSLFAVLGIQLAAAFTCPAIAQDAETLCHEQSASKFIRIALCEENADDEELVAEGRRICDAAMPCGVWFYVDETIAPEVAPENHDGLTQEQIVGSLGVFVAESDYLMRIESVEN